MIQVSCIFGKVSVHLGRFVWVSDPSIDYRTIQERLRVEQGTDASSWGVVPDDYIITSVPTQWGITYVTDSYTWHNKTVAIVYYLFTRDYGAR